MLPWNIIRVSGLKCLRWNVLRMMDGSGWICLTPSQKPARCFLPREPKVIQRHSIRPLFHVSKDTGKVLENWVRATAVHINSLTLTARAFLIGGRQWEQALSSLTFPKWQPRFSPAVTSVNFISKWDLEGLGLKSAPSFWFPPHNDFHGVQDLNGGEIMSASHYCRLYPPLRPSLNS